MLGCPMEKPVRISEHLRRAHWVRGHHRNTRYGRVWVEKHIRSGSIVSAHCRSVA